MNREIMAPRIKIEDVLPSGEKITVTLEGPEISKTRVLQLLDLLKIMGGEVDDGRGTSSLKERIWRVIEEYFGSGEWFSIRELHRVLLEFEPGIKVTTVATYLGRFVSEGRLVKTGRRPSTRYRVRMAVKRL